MNGSISLLRDIGMGALGAITILLTLFITFMTLKITGSIDWSWWMVAAPLWVVPALGIIALIGYGIGYFGMKFLLWAFCNKNAR